MHDRGMIKWMPFNSVVSSKEIINSILKDKSKISMPILSEEQKDVNEQKLLIAYYSKSKINISYYQNGNINLINSYIIHLNKLLY